MGSRDITCTDCGHRAPLAQFVDHYCPPVEPGPAEGDGPCLFGTHAPRDCPARVFGLNGTTQAACPIAPLPLHRTEAGYPSCGICDGGGCYDCTDPA